MPNRLAGETSPYLRQHAGNPVDWYPWGDEAFAEARRTDRPVLLSIGYSACHWCHVMAHESFEDPDIAALMNELFVCVKVDREERPDVDTVYMQAVQAISGHGGWPMTVFLTPAGAPFYGGTYFPPADRLGLPGFPSVLRGVIDAYRTRRDEVDSTAKQLRQRLAPPRLQGGDEPDPALLDRAAHGLMEQTDRRSGGFGGAPKFPHAAAIDVLLRRTRATGDQRFAEAALVTLDHMARGGVYDQVGGGFHRYSVDARWAVPHFEKMLYDNALLAPVYLHAGQMTGDARWLRVSTQVLDYLAREMRVAGGGFASAQDADSEGGEGSFYVWTPAELDAVLGPADSELAGRVFGVSASGNFEHGATVLSLPESLRAVAAALDIPEPELSERVDGIRRRLLDARDARPHPARDDKVITSWNALALRAFAEAGAVLGRDDYVEIASACAAFISRELVRDGVLLRAYRDGQAKITGFLEDVAFLADALLTLYEATGDPAHFAWAQRLAEDVERRFRDAAGGLFDTAVDGEPLLVRPRSLDDMPIPAGQSIAAQAFLRLHALTGEQRWRERAMEIIRPLAATVGRAPIPLANLACALEMALSPPVEVAVVGDAGDAATHALLRAVQERFDPLRVLAWGAADGVPLLEGRMPVDGRPAAYVCRDFACEAPVTDGEALAAQLARR